MKKIHVMLVALAALLSSNAVMANENLNSGKNTIQLTTCSQLANDINITISGGVTGSLDCTTDTVIIGLAVCHSSGLTTSRSYSETPTGPVDGNGNPTCTVGTMNSTTNMCEGTTTGGRFPTATTNAGTVSSNYPGANCTQAEAATVATDAVTAAVNN